MLNVAIHMWVIAAYRARKNLYMGSYRTISQIIFSALLRAIPDTVWPYTPFVGFKCGFLKLADRSLRRKAKADD